MGSGIGIVAARHAGMKVTFVDPSDKQLLNCQIQIDKWCDKEIGKGRMSEEEKV